MKRWAKCQEAYADEMLEAMRNLKALSQAAESLREAGPLRPACAECGLWGGCQSPGMLPFVPKGYTGQLLVVGEAPGKDEDARNRPFVGAAGQLLRGWLRDSEVPDEGVAFVNTVRCRPPKNVTPTMKQIRCCRPFLLAVIDKLAPRAILGMGGSALRAFTNDGGQSNVTRARGRLIPVSRLSVVGAASCGPGDSRTPCSGLSGGDSPVSGRITYHPAAVLYPGGTHLSVYVKEDIRRVTNEVAPGGYGGGPPPSSLITIDTEGASILALDVEWAPDKTLLTVGVADGQHAEAVEAN